MPDLMALFEKALKLHPDLWHATQLVARVQDKNVFPIKTVEALVALLADKPGLGHCKLDGVTLTPEHASEYFPVAFLPITNEAQLLTKLYAAFCAGRRIHLLEAEVDHFKRSIAEVGAHHAQ
jgi:hypothetical protein